MNKTLLLCTWLFTIFGAALVSAAPVMDAARAVSQTGIAPIYMQYDSIKAALNGLHGAQELIADVREPSAGLTDLGKSLATLSEIIDESGRSNPADRVIIKQQGGEDQKIDGEGFAATASKMLNSKHPDLVKFAAKGWDMSERKASTKFASLAKTPSFEGTHDQIIAILIGMMDATRTETVDKNEALGLKINEALEDSKEKWVILESVQ